MNFELTEEQRMIREMVRDFADREITPHAANWDERAEFPAEAVRKLGELGLMGVPIPAEDGGAGADYVSYALVIEELSRADAATGVICSAHTSLACDPLARFASDAQRARFLRPLASGKGLGCYSLSEPQTGSDAASLQCTATRTNGEWVINGRKVFVTNGREADVTLFFATHDKAAGHLGVCAFAIEKGHPGFAVGSILHKLGIRASSTVELLFDHCVLTDDHLIGKPGDGFKIAMSALDGGRIGIAAQAVGIARAALEAAAAYGKVRLTFGRPIVEHQAIQNMIADMAMWVAGARLLVLRAATLRDRQERYTEAAAKAKLFASDIAMKATRLGVQVFGGYGYSVEYPVERFYRDAKITEIYEGTSEVMRMVIARDLLRD